jgi:hypothetical protein
MKFEQLIDNIGFQGFAHLQRLKANVQKATMQQPFRLHKGILARSHTCPVLSLELLSVSSADTSSFLPNISVINSP